MITSILNLKDSTGLNPAIFVHSIKHAFSFVIICSTRWRRCHYVLVNSWLCSISWSLISQIFEGLPYATLICALHPHRVILCCFLFILGLVYVASRSATGVLGSNRVALALIEKPSQEQGNVLLSTF